MMMNIKAYLLSCCLLFLCCSTVLAIHQGEGDLPYSQKMEHPLDEPVNAKYGGKAFFMNLGPTGIRARINPNAPKEFLVQFVFKNSPAAGKINIGDRIVGANGRKFVNAHGFHRKKGGRGWVGPPYELALAIEDSQGKDGELELIVKPGGTGKETKVTVKIKAVGRFSKTWPWDCPRSDKLREDLVEFMLKEGTKARLWLEIQYTIALWASGDERAVSLARQLGQRLSKGTADPMDGGMCTWTWGYQGIFLGEYYNAFKDKRVLPAVESLVECYETSQDYRNGGCSHRPFPAIQRRIADGGPKGYGAMAGPGGLSMLAQSIFRETGLPYSPIAYNRTHISFLQTAGGNSSGAIAYGFKGWPAVHIRLKNPDKSPCKSKRGIGFLCPTGLKNIGDYEVEKWTEEAAGKWNMKLVSPSKEFGWLKSEEDTLRVYDQGKNRRLVVRPQYFPEPSGPYRTDERGGGHNAPVGMGALAHYIGNKDNVSWNHLGQHMATCCANSPKTLWDGHAAAPMHAFFGVLGAARANEKALRNFLDYTKTWIILSETHEDRKKGGLVEQPFGCQRNATCSIPRDRRNYTHIALLLVALPKRRLLVTGAPTSNQDSDNPMPSLTGPGFEIKHCKREVRMLEKGTPFMKIFQSLLKSLEARKEEEQKEAKELGDRLKKWVVQHTEELLDASRKEPARALPRLKEWLLRVEGLPPKTRVAARVAEIEGYTAVNDLLKVYDKYKDVMDDIREKGPSKKTDKKLSKLRKTLDAFMTRDGLNAELLKEAKALRSAM